MIGVVGRIIGPKDIHILFPGTYEFMSWSPFKRGWNTRRPNLTWTMLYEFSSFLKVWTENSHSSGNKIDEKSQVFFSFHFPGDSCCILPKNLSLTDIINKTKQTSKHKLSFPIHSSKRFSKCGLRTTDQEQQHPFGIYTKCKISAPFPDLLNQTSGVGYGNPGFRV